MGLNVLRSIADTSCRCGGKGMNAIHHVAVICSDKEAAVEFYSRKLGFPVIRSNFRPERDDWKIDLRINETRELELFIMKDRPERVTNPEAYGLRHLAFRVSSVEETAEELERKESPASRSERTLSPEKR